MNCMLACLFCLIYLSPHHTNHRLGTVVQPHKFAVSKCSFSGNAESLNYVSNNKICTHSWLTILLAKEPQVGIIKQTDHSVYTF